MTQPISAAFPELYQRLFPDLLHSPIPGEVHATCDDCAMCSPAGDGDPNIFFSPNAKCCTYHPTLPNYLVGGLLEDGDPALDEGRRRVRERIDRRIGVSPRGVLPSRKAAALTRSADGAFFGWSQALLCPYFQKDNGGCTVWKFRESTCSTYFCKFVKGADGSNLWQAIKDYVATMEHDLASHVLLELGFDADAVLRVDSSKLTLDELDEVTGETPAYRELWGDWLGREEELYRRSHEIVAGLSLEQVRRIGGINADLKLGRVEDRYRNAIDPQLPAVLQRNPDLRVTRGPEGEYVVLSFSSNQPTRLEKPMYECLDYFDGRHTTAEVLARLEEEQHVKLSADLLTKLYQFRILTRVDPS